MKKYISVILVLVFTMLFSCTKSKECPEEKTILNSVNEKLGLMNNAAATFVLSGTKESCLDMAKYYEEAIDEIKKWEGCAEKYGYSQEQWRSSVNESEFYKEIIQASCQ